jgi:hypothetical protein
VGPRRPASRPRARRGVPVLRHHHHRARHHRSHHRHPAHRRHLMGSSSNSSGRPAFRVAGRSMAPSKCSPILVLASVVIMRTGLNPSLFARASSPSTSKAVPAGGLGAQQQASPGSHAPAGGSAAAEPPMASGAAAAEGVPTAPSAAAEEAPAASAPSSRSTRGRVQLCPAVHFGGDGRDLWAAAPVRRRARSGASSPPPGAVSSTLGPSRDRGGDPTGVGGAGARTPAPE